MSLYAPRARQRPGLAPLPGARLHALGRVWPILAVFVTVIGGIYGGIFTPTEAAAVAPSPPLRWR